MKNIKKNLVFSFILLMAYTGTNAQDDLSAIADAASGDKPKEYTTATFKGTRLINFHTLETVGRRSLDFRISHRFGDFNTGAYNAWGLDGGASIRLGLEYSYDGRLQFGIGRTSAEKMIDGFAKYRLIRQTDDNKTPFSVTLLSCMFSTMLKDGAKATNGYDKYEHFSSRLSYCHQIIIGRKFSSRFSLQVAPTFVHYNLVDKITDKNDVYALAVAARYKFTKRAAITAEYAWRINKYTNEKYYDSAGIGIDIETGGHVFQLHFTNSFGIVENQFIGHTDTSWKNFGVRLGFNISRVFTI